MPSRSSGGRRGRDAITNRFVPMTADQPPAVQTEICYCTGRGGHIRAVYDLCRYNEDAAYNAERAVAPDNAKRRDDDPTTVPPDAPATRRGRHAAKLLADLTRIDPRRDDDPVHPQDCYSCHG